MIREAGFDGIEAATPVPQGDVTLDELKEAMGDTILLDGISAILFLADRSYQEVEECANTILELFSPNLILGISDEPPPASLRYFESPSRKIFQSVAPRTGLELLLSASI